jgi:hypothetical protein
MPWAPRLRLPLFFDFTCKQSRKLGRRTPLTDARLLSTHVSVIGETDLAARKNSNQVSIRVNSQPLVFDAQQTREGLGKVQHLLGISYCPLWLSVLAITFVLLLLRAQ